MCQVVFSLLSEDLDVWLLCLVPYKYLVRKGGECIMLSTFVFWLKSQNFFLCQVPYK